MVLTDTHTHLYADSLKEDRAELMLSAGGAGVSRFFLPNIDRTSINAMLDLESKHPDSCFAMMGLHPCSVKEDWEEELKLIEDWLGRRRFCAIGEIGIDLYWDKTFEVQQRNVFLKQVDLANQLNLPIVIHSRESMHVLFDLLNEVKKESPCGIFHCFTGTTEQAQRAIDMGFYLGIGGVLTFKNSGLDKVLEQIPLEHLVLETDAPYLAPTPHRGKRNIPEYLRLIAERLAQVKNVSVEEVAQITTENSLKIFGV